MTPLGRIVQKHPVSAFVVLTCLINWLGIVVMIAGYFPPCGEWVVAWDGQPVAEFRGRRTLLTWAPNIAAMIVAGVIGGGTAIKDLMGRFLLWKVGRRWWLAALLLPVVLTAATLGLYEAIGGRLSWNHSQYWIPVFGLRLLFSLTSGGIGEEGGWRGFVLPRLQAKWGAVSASLMIGGLWAVSHAATWSLRAMTWQQMVPLTVSLLGLSVVLTWVYNRSGGSLLLVVLVHTLVNVLESVVSRSIGAIIPSSEFLTCFSVVLMAFAVMLVATTKGDLGAPPRDLGASGPSRS